MSDPSTSLWLTRGSCNRLSFIGLSDVSDPRVSSMVRPGGIVHISPGLPVRGHNGKAPAESRILMVSRFQHCQRRRPRRGTVDASLAASRAASRLAEATVLTIAAQAGDRHKEGTVATSIILCDVASKRARLKASAPDAGRTEKSSAG